jgi:hypothetical protein
MQHAWRVQKYFLNILDENVKGTVHLGGPDVDGIMILE